VRVVALWSYYRPYLHGFYARHAGLASRPFAEQLELLLRDYFTWPPYVALRLRELGHDVEFVLANAPALNRAWAREYAPTLLDANEFEIVQERVRRVAPDILWIGPIFDYYGPKLHALRSFCKRVITWIAAPLRPFLDLTGIDCVLTSHHNLADAFRRSGLAAERMLPAFETNVLAELGSTPSRDIGACFVGTVSWAHAERLSKLARLVRQARVDMWILNPPLLTKSLLRPKFYRSLVPYMRLRKHSRGEVFGVDMYRVLARARLSLNIHIGIAGGLAGNQRMFESTGMGALLVTDGKANLHEMFVPGEEVISFDSCDELIDIVKHFEGRERDAATIAQRGRDRTLREHSTLRRADELERIFMRYL
jgi:hypothetical protein